MDTTTLQTPKMDLSFETDNRKDVPGEMNNNISEDPSMEELIFSMKSSLLGELNHQPAPPGDVQNPPLCSSPIDKHLLDSSLSMDAGRNRSFEDVFDDTLTLDDIATPPVEERGGRGRHVERGCQGSQEPDDGQFTSSDLPLTNGYHGNEEEDEDLGSTREHPRLQSNFYQRLKEKYPKAFQRRSSVSSEVASVCSDAGPGEPTTVMSPMPKGHYRSSLGSTDVVDGSQSHLGTRYGGSLPPPHPSLGSNKRSTLNENNTHQTMEGAHLGDQIEDVSRHLSQDLSITGTIRRSKSPPRRPWQDLKLTMNDRKIAGILKKDLDILNTSTTSHSSISPYDNDSSQLSLKERLQKNQLTLRALLSEENNPLRKSRPWKNRKTSTLNKSFDSDVTLDNELSISIETPDGHNGKRNAGDGLLLMPKLTPTHAENTSVAIDTIEQKRSLVDQPMRKHMGTKRYVSPDSSHDSAVDMDTASLQSSPGSSDTQTTVNTCRPNKTKSGVRGYEGGGGRVSQNSGMLSTDTEISPRDRHRVSSEHHQEYQLTHTSSTHTKGDSDVDSGIAHGAYRSHGSRERTDSSSSMENDQEMESIMSLSRVHSGPRYTTISSQDLRTSSRQRYSSGNKGKSGPLKADHSIQPSSPRHPHRGEELSNAYLIGQQYKASSSSDISQKRGSPISRVRFEDELSEISQQDLTPQQRTLSHPDMSITPDSSPRTPDQLSGGSRRAPKLRGGRRNSPSPGPPGTRPAQPDTKSGSSATPGPSGTRGLPPSGRHQDVRTKMHKLRNQTKTPTEMIYAAANDESFNSETKDMSVHRASPVVVTQSDMDTYSYIKSPEPDDVDLNDEVAQLNGFNDAWMYALTAKSSNKPWKRNKGKYNPSEGVESVQRELQRTQVRTVLSRPGSSQGEAYSIDKLPNKGRVPRPASCTAEIHTPNERLQSRIEHLYDEVKNQSFASSSSSSSGRHNTENLYEEVRFNKDSKKEDDVYAVPERKSRSRTRSRGNPGVVTDQDESIEEEVAPPIPDRGYTSDLERYKDLSGSRTSLSSKMGSFRKAAKNTWSALRRAVSLERVDNAGVADEGPEFKLKKSPSLQSLAKKFSFKKRDKNKYSASPADLPPKPTQSRLNRPSSAPLGRSKKYSSSLTSLNTVDSPQNFRPIGKLKQLNPDGTQIIELVRPPKGPFGFYIARGNAKYGGGVFVSRMSDGLPDHFFAGLLGVGDEILEINCQLIDNLTLDEVYTIMSERHHLLLKTLPYVARKDT